LNSNQIWYWDLSFLFKLDWNIHLHLWLILQSVQNEAEKWIQNLLAHILEWFFGMETPYLTDISAANLVQASLSEPHTVRSFVGRIVHAQKTSTNIGKLTHASLITQGIISVIYWIIHIRVCTLRVRWLLTYVSYVWIIHIRVRTFSGYVRYWRTYHIRVHMLLTYVHLQGYVCRWREYVRSDVRTLFCRHRAYVCCCHRLGMMLHIFFHYSVQPLDVYGDQGMFRTVTNTISYWLDLDWN